MSDESRIKALSADEIERRFHSTAVQGARPLLWGSIHALRKLMRFDWKAHFDCDLERIDSPLVFAANHRSHADTAAILGTLPRSLRDRTAVAAALDVFGPDDTRGLKRKLSKDCLQFLVASGFHAFAFDRQGPPLRSVRTSVQLIRHGWNLLLYPEGTRSRTGEMGPFKPGVGVLAKFTGKPVVPVFVEGGNHLLPYGASMPRPALVLVRYGQPMWFEDGDTPEDFSQRLYEAVWRLGARQARANARLAHIAGRQPRRPIVSLVTGRFGRT